MRADDPRFQLAVRRDRRSNAAIILTVVAMMAAVVSMLVVSVDDVTSRHSDPVYWIVMLPFAAWGVGLITSKPFALKTIVPLLCIFPVLAALALIAASARGRDTVPHWLALAVCVAASAAAAAARRGAVLGDARRE